MEVKNLSLSEKQKCSGSETGKFEKYEHHISAILKKVTSKLIFQLGDLVPSTKLSNSTSFSFLFHFHSNFLI